jgi:hypothetical protein
MLRVFAALVFCSTALADDAVRQAVDLFNQGKTEPQKYVEAAAMFAKAAKTETLTTEQQAAWAYCRVRLAAEQWNASKGDAAVKAKVIAEASEALALAPEYAELQKFGREVIVAAGGTLPAIEKPKTETGWFSLESDNFRVRYPAAAKDIAETLSKKAEEQRTAIFTKWSGPPSGNWNPKCEIVVQPSAEDFAHATNQPPSATGHAIVQLETGKPSLRRIDVRMDDANVVIDAMPRELTHIILADLFPVKAPPRWAADGMAALAMSPETVDRYLKTAATMAAKSELPAASTLLEAKDSKGNATARLVGSASLADFLVRSKGERSLTVFLRDTQRYGLEKSIDRQFGFATLKALDAAWNRELKK